MIRRSIEWRDNPRNAASAGILEYEISKYSNPTIYLLNRHHFNSFLGIGILTGKITLPWVNGHYANDLFAID